MTDNSEGQPFDSDGIEPSFEIDGIESCEIDEIESCDIYVCNLFETDKMTDDEKTLCRAQLLRFLTFHHFGMALPNDAKLLRRLMVRNERFAVLYLRYQGVIDRSFFN